MAKDIRMNWAGHFRSERGSVAIIASVLLAAVATFFIGSLIGYESSLKNSASFVDQSKTFYRLESIEAIAVAKLQQYLFENPADADEMTAVLCTSLPDVVPVGFSIESCTVSVGAQSNTALPNGPYAGIAAPQTEIKLTLGIRNSATSHAVVKRVEVTLILAQIFPFQFSQFIDLDYADWFPLPDTSVDGRFYVKGDFCFANASTSVTRFRQLIIGGRAMYISDARCRYPNDINVGHHGSTIATDSAGTAYATLDIPRSNGCTNCGSTSLAWPEYSEATWRGFLRDKDSGVTTLGSPLTQSAQTQQGVNGNGFVATSNRTGMRFLVDPPISADSSAILKAKYSQQADIRIIDGVWYIKNKTNPSAWPGLPIWSDHPGRATAFSMGVGQDDIRDFWATTSLPWTAGTTPRAYSYYEYDAAAQNLGSEATGVVSYGILKRAGTSWSPAFLFSGTGNAGNAICIGTMPTYTPSTLPGPPYTALAPEVAIDCGVSAGAPNTSTYLLLGARSGFRNRNIWSASAAANDAHDKILPVNFNVLAFQDALTNTGAGELGTYFGVGSYWGRAFNGVIFISGTWPQSLDGFDGGQPTMPPIQGNQFDTNQMLTVHPSQQRALPYPLCSNSPTDSPSGLAGQSFDRNAANNRRFVIPSCSSYGTSFSAYPNAVRIHGGENLKPSVLTKGLSIVSNLPVYLLGNYNTHSDVSTVTSTPWVPSLVAGDQLTFLSSAWSDPVDHWTAGVQPLEVAGNTTYNTALMTGYARASGTNGIQGIPALVEDWSGKTMTTNGSIVVGFYPVYQRSGLSTAATTFRPPIRVYRYDPHFSLATNQPPGTFTYPASAIYQWKGH